MRTYAPETEQNDTFIGIFICWPKISTVADKSDTTYSPGTDEAADGDPVSAVVFEPDVEEAGLLRGPVAGVISASSSHDR